MGIDRGAVALFLGTALLATSCGLLPPPDFKSLAAAADVDPASLVIRDRVAYGTRLHGDELSVVAFDAAGNVVVVGSRRTDRLGSTVAIGGGMMTGDVEPCCILVYGTAGPDIAKVEVDAETLGAGGAVVNGTWLVVIPQGDTDLALAKLPWRFIGHDGSVVESGDGTLMSMPAPTNSPQP